MEAFGRLAALPDFSDVDLVLVGEIQERVFYSEFSRIKDQVTALHLTERVIFTGFLPDAELVVLLNLAAVCVLPSLMEGFGLPAIEAAACGCPVVATTASPLPELLGEGGLYVDPLATAALVSALGRVLSSEALRGHMRQAALAAVRRLTWEKAASQMLAVLEEVSRR